MAATSPSDIDVPGRILAAARRRLADGGFRELTFRPIAEDCGLTLAAVTYHFGLKDRLIETLVSQEQIADAQRHRQFAARFADLPRLDPAALSACIEIYLDEAAADGRETTLIWTEALLRAGVDEPMRTLVAPWTQQRRTFWRDFTAGRCSDSEAWAEAIFSYVTDEAVHGAAQRDVPDYRLLRRMALERICDRLAPRREGGLSQLTFFKAVVARLDSALQLPSAAFPSTPPDGRRAAIALAAGEVIVIDGAEALTHRAVGARAGAPASSVAYYFKTRLDLMKGGIEVLYLVAQRRLSWTMESGDQPRAVARGTLAVALAAARDPLLTPFAIDLRRLRGENLHVRLAEHTGDPNRFDLCDAQAASIVGMGATVLGDAQPPGSALASPVEWLLGISFLN